MKKIIPILLACFFIAWCDNSENCKDPERWHNGERFWYVQEFWSTKENKCIQTSDVFSYTVWWFYTQDWCIDYEKCWHIDYQTPYQWIAYRTKDNKEVIKGNCDKDCYRDITKQIKLEYLEEINKTVWEEVVKVIR